MNQKPNDGFLIVASKTKSFYISAKFLADSIKDYMPDAKVCLVVDEDLIDDHNDMFDHMIFTERQYDYRAKLWGMSKSPFDRTLYLDADMECCHEDVKGVFELLGDHDMMFTEIKDVQRPIFKTSTFPAGKFTYNGGVCLYNSSRTRVIDFMYRWWELYCLQKNDLWWPTDPDTGKWAEKRYGDRHDMKWWDQFTLWYLLNEDPEWKDMNVEIIPEGERYNEYSLFWANMRNEKGAVFRHYSRGLSKDNPAMYTVNGQ